MTRMWGIDPALLCEEHLLGEHVEMHQEVGTLENHPHGEAVVRGHAEAEQIDTAVIGARHDELAAEMDRRGMAHDSPLDYDDELGLGGINVEENRRELAERRDACRRRIEGTD